MSKSYGAVSRSSGSPEFGSPSNRFPVSHSLVSRPSGSTEFGSLSNRFPVSHSLGSAINPDIPEKRKAEIVKRHLASPEVLARSAESADGQTDDPYAFYSTSHMLLGGEVAHEVYKWHKGVESQPMKRTRSRSLYLPRPEPADPHIANIRQPGGFRRHYVSMQARAQGKEPNFVTKSFIDFLTMYDQFAGEELSDDEDDDTFSEYDHVTEEEMPLISSTPQEGTASVSKAVFLLLKSFVGTGVMFLPRAFLNGGMTFSFIVLIGIASISLFTFLLLVETRLVVPESFGGIGNALYGSWMKSAVLFSITISQIGFVCAYMIFVAENLHSFTKHALQMHVEERWFILGQVLCFVPLAMIRKISRLSITAVIADVFILFGLTYLYYYDIFKLSRDGLADIRHFNSRTFSLFIGTAVFTFEGIGLIIPITESMREPQKFPKVLTGVMIFITIIFVSIGVLSYAAFGSKVEKVVILNLPYDEPIVLAVQLLYALAIALSIPLQLFPAIRIMEQGIFSTTRSGKIDQWVKWQKNLFRVLTVSVCAIVAWGGAQNLDNFVSLIGSFACAPLCFLYPPMFHLKAVARSFTAIALDLVVIAFGLFAMFYTTYVSISLWHEAK